MTTSTLRPILCVSIWIAIGSGGCVPASTPNNPIAEVDIELPIKGKYYMAIAIPGCRSPKPHVATSLDRGTALECWCESGSMYLTVGPVVEGEGHQTARCVWSDGTYAVVQVSPASG